MSDMPSAGTIVKIGTAVAPSGFAAASALDAAGYAALAGLKAIGSGITIGALPIGDKFNTGTYATHDDRREKTKKTTKTNPEWQLTCAWDPDNAGQDAAIAASATDNWYPVVVEWPDAPAGGTPTRAYFHALVLDAEAGESAANAEKVDMVVRCQIMTKVIVVKRTTP